ncbi:hypothetical protein B0H15DRAFT_847955 [Mycena belliarum]|uniref:DUF6697 domain-containing protein n=1 Tax=Mycena belliarum TaxID=1033014 RepID=A0AAD6U4X4_9AGAR|nr:hypothetical protein B0H15DRAFT_847955 [Mycena belliae]
MAAVVAGPRLLPQQEIPQGGLDDLLQIKKDPGIPSLKISDPLSVVEMALEVEVERARAVEALTARDAAIERLSDAYLSLRQKITIIERLQQAPQAESSSSTVNEQVPVLEMTVKTLREQLAMATSLNVPVRCVDIESPPSYDENGIDHTNPGQNPQLVRPASRPPLRVPRETPLFSSSHLERPIIDENDLDYQAQTAPKPTPSPSQSAPKSNEPADIIKARHALLATIPLPLDPPDDTLKPIVIPPPFTLHEFLANATGPLRNVLSNYRVLQELTTSWCPDREEHGYLLTPLFKCSTNPRVATAHRWNLVDVMARMSKPTECFYNKDGNWYYAGVYKGFRLEDLTTKEWEVLSAEVCHTLSSRPLLTTARRRPRPSCATRSRDAKTLLRRTCTRRRSCTPREHCASRASACSASDSIRRCTAQCWSRRPSTRLRVNGREHQRQPRQVLEAVGRGTLRWRARLSTEV